MTVLNSIYQVFDSHDIMALAHVAGRRKIGGMDGARFAAEVIRFQDDLAKLYPAFDVAHLADRVATFSDTESLIARVQGYIADMQCCELENQYFTRQREAVESIPTPKSYHVIFEDFDTRIQEWDDAEHKYRTFSEAKTDALAYLRDMAEPESHRTHERMGSNSTVR